jgi:hypothetical protein
MTLLGYICPAGHVTPRADETDEVVRCRFRVGALMECSRDAVLVEHDPCDCRARYLPGRPYQCVHEFERRRAPME